MNFVEVTPSKERDYGSLISISLKDVFKERLMISHYHTCYGKMFYKKVEHMHNVKGLEDDFHIYSHKKELGDVLDEKFIALLNSVASKMSDNYTQKFNEALLSFHINCFGNHIFIYFKGFEFFKPHIVKDEHIEKKEADIEFFLEFVRELIVMFKGEDFVR